MSGTGKIARLPHELRELVNQKLVDSVPGRQIVDWLNGLPEVREVMLRDFEGRPISEQNLTEWKHGGWRQWFARQEAFLCAAAAAGDAGELAKSAGGSLADHLATIIASKYAVAISEWNGDPDPAYERTLRTLGEICRNLHQLRRGDHSVVRIRMQQARITLQGAREEKHILDKFREWLLQDGGWKYMTGGEGIPPEEQFERFFKHLTGKEPPKLPPNAEDPTQVPTS